MGRACSCELLLERAPLHSSRQSTGRSSGRSRARLRGHSCVLAESPAKPLPSEAAPIAARVGPYNRSVRCPLTRLGSGAGRRSRPQAIGA